MKQSIKQTSEGMGGAVLLLLAGLAATPTSASAVPYTECPSIGFAKTCNVLLTIDATGALTVGVDSTVNAYDGAEDQMLGVTNLWNRSVSAIALVGKSIFGFDFDGAGSVNCDIFGGGGTYGCHYDLGPTGYEGLVNGDPSRLITFNVIDADHGSAIFAGGLQPGETGWFSLEEPPSAATGITGHVVPVPEPAMLSLVGLGLVGIGWARRQSKQAQLLG